MHNFFKIVLQNDVCFILVRRVARRLRLPRAPLGHRRSLRPIAPRCGQARHDAILGLHHRGRADPQDGSWSQGPR